MIENDTLPISVQETFRLIGRKWAINILYLLMNDPHTFGDLKNNIQGISSSVLSDLLNTFIEEEIVEKKILSISPKKTEYFLTEFGLVLCEIVESILKWGDLLLDRRSRSANIKKINLE